MYSMQICKIIFVIFYSPWFWKEQNSRDRFRMGRSTACKCPERDGNAKTEFDNHSDRRVSEQKKNCSSTIFSRLRTGTFGTILW